MWLVELQDLAYDIDDVLDGMATEVMKRKFEESDASSSSSSSKLLKMLPACCTSLTPHNIMYGRNISSNLDVITTRLNGLFEQRKTLRLKPKKVKSSNKTDVRYLETALLPDASKILGREGDKEALLGKLLGDEGACSYQNVSIVSIVGMGGIGKTTLARLLYNDPKVNDHFDVKAWVCVSDDFDVLDISKQIYQAVGGEERPFASLNLLHEALQKELSNKRFLLVLDDVWNEQHDKWEALKRPLVGAPGSKILVTARSTKVSTVMKSVQPYNLGFLSNELALSLFARCALDEENFEKHQQLKSIAQGIVDKCKGLPLALIALGRVLNTEGSDDAEWEELLKSDIWNSQHGTNILPALKLSYHHLPSHLKQPFAYCSLFPKDYVFKKNKLILLWMAQGFLSQPKGNNQPMESLGHKYFKELLSRSFFQPVANDESLCTMHDLMNDLAISVAGEFFFLLDDKKDLNGRNEDFEKFRHFSFIGKPDAVVFRNLDRARCLRTFLPVSVGWKGPDAFENVPVELLPQLRFLRVLSLSSGSIREVPESIDKLKHLRYLNFSSSSIKVLPEQVSELYNLQTLLVRECYELSSLPVSFVKLINLRHLDMSHTPSLKKTPIGIGGLTSLQTLSKVVIQEDNGFKISELKGLKDLQGGLSIEGLEKVIDPTEAKDANLQQKKGLDDLELLWGSSPLFGDSHYPSTKDEVLERLWPHHNLKNLKIIGYGGEKFPSWIGDPSSSSSLKTLLIKDCKNLKSVLHGHFQSLTSLEELEIYGCPSMEYSFGCGLWPPNLRRLIIGESDPRDYVLQKPTFEYNVIEGLRAPQCKLEKLEIDGYSEMKIPSWIGDPSFNQLTELRLKGCGYFTELQTIGHLTSLRVVKIEWCYALESYCCPNSVERLSIKNCHSITSLTFSKLPEELPYSLKKLTLLGLWNLESIPHEHFQCLATLEELTILHCHPLPFPSCGSLWPPNLRKLTIGDLGRIMSDWGLQNYPPSLVELELYCKGSGVVSFGVMEQQDHNNNNTTSSACFLLPPSLTSLRIRDMEEVESVSEVLQHLPHLQRLHIRGCQKLREVPETTSSLKVDVEKEPRGFGLFLKTGIRRNRLL